MAKGLASSRICGLLDHHHRPTAAWDDKHWLYNVIIYIYVNEYHQLLNTLYKLFTW
jgi:hypothetical protein